MRIGTNILDDSSNLQQNVLTYTNLAMRILITKELPPFDSVKTILSGPANACCSLKKIKRRI